MRILLTNDDGIQAEGIESLRRVFEKREDTSIYIVAPDRERSGSGHSITFHAPLRVEEKAYDHPHVKGYAVNGTPSDCVKLAIKAILPEPPDLIVSGINNGANLGTDVLYSGTVSAAIEGIMLDIPSIAVSLTSFDCFDYCYAAEFANNMLEKIVGKKLPPNTLLNINIPPGKEEEIKGLMITSLGVRQYEHIFDKRTDPFGRTYYWLAGEPLEVEHDTTTDIKAIKDGYISVTPIHFDLTNYEIMESLADWELDSLCSFNDEEKQEREGNSETESKS